MIRLIVAVAAGIVLAAIVLHWARPPAVMRTRQEEERYQRAMWAVWEQDCRALIHWPYWREQLYECLVICLVLAIVVTLALIVAGLFGVNL